MEDLASSVVSLEHPRRAPRLLLLACISLITGCSTSSSAERTAPTTAPAAAPANSLVPAEAAIDPLVAQEFDRHGIRPDGPVREFLDTLPTNLLATARWGVLVGACQGGGYDLTAAAGHPVRMLRYPIPDVLRDEPLYAWALLDGDQVACVYRSVREDSEMAPGVFAAH